MTKISGGRDGWEMHRARTTIGEALATYYDGAMRKAPDERPPHFSSLSLKNFRGFGQRTALPLAPLTFLVGPNSSGKSSICDALLLLAQSRIPTGAYQNFRPTWSDELVDLGSFPDAVFRHDIRKTICIDFELRNLPIDAYYWRPSRLPPVAISLELATKSDDLIGFVRELRILDQTSNQTLSVRRVGRGGSGIAVRVSSDRRSAIAVIKDQAEPPWRPLNALTRKFNRTVPARAKRWEKIISCILTPSWGLSFFLGGMIRVSSARGAPQRWYARNRTLDPDSRLYQTVDPAFLEYHQRAAVRRKQRTLGNLADVLRELDIADEIEPGDLGPYHSAINVRDSITKVTSNLIDVGYGASQVIPLIAACLRSDARGRSAPLIVEQPEIHLHPRAQGTVAELLAHVSLHRQVIVETHSEHMINKARLLVAKGSLPASSVVINYVSRDQRGSHVATIPLLDSGDFGAQWPEGFFDERYQDTLKLARAKRDGDR